MSKKKERPSIVSIPLSAITAAEQGLAPVLTDFDSSYVPWIGSQRRARISLLQLWCKTRDPYVAERLRRQELAEIPLIERLQAMFGKKMDWRLAMCLEAKVCRDTQTELGNWLSCCVVNNKVDELKLFAKRIDRINRPGLSHRAKVIGLRFVMKCWIEKGFLPTRIEVRKVIIQSGHKLSKESRNDARDIFEGPILGTLPMAKAGAKPITLHKK